MAQALRPVRDLPSLRAVSFAQGRGAWGGALRVTWHRRVRCACAGAEARPGSAHCRMAGGRGIVGVRVIRLGVGRP